MPAKIKKTRSITKTGNIFLPVNLLYSFIPTLSLLIPIPSLLAPITYTCNPHLVSYILTRNSHLATCNFFLYAKRCTLYAIFNSLFHLLHHIIYLLFFQIIKKRQGNCPSRPTSSVIGKSPSLYPNILQNSSNS